MVRVLVADDNSAFLDAVIDLIDVTKGFELACVARTGEEAVELAVSTHPDLVLLDLRMPGIGGVEAGAMIQAASPGTRVVLMTIDPARWVASTETPIDKRGLTPEALISAWHSSVRHSSVRH
jgi:DNA-binding NarL/FixJ family response regulator